jgi:hypothetical protein
VWDYPEVARTSKDQTYPREIRSGSVTVKIYRVRHKKSRKGFLYTVAFVDLAKKRHTPQFADPVEAENEARLKAVQLSSGNLEAAEVTKADRDLLLALRQKCGEVPILAAIEEWVQAREITGSQILPAARAWAAVNAKGFKPIFADVCVDQFIAARGKAGGDAERTYRSKLKPIKTAFAKRELHSISTAEWQAYLKQWANDGVTHNDFRKRATSMCLWARRQGFLPRSTELEVSLTDKMPEKSPKIGIISPETFGHLLVYLKEHYPEYLAAAVVAGFLGVRSDEIHGKRKDDREKRQLWEDIHLLAEEPLLTVTNAKENTPAWRTVPICAAAIEWLKLCPTPHEGPICSKAAMEQVRKIGLTAKLKLPENCFRHSYISYQVVLTGNKHQVSTWAGNSVKEIDRRYRRPVFAETGQALDTEQRVPVTKKIAGDWLALTPAAAKALRNQIPPPAPQTASS